MGAAMAPEMLPDAAERAAIARRIGARLREARENLGIPQTAAARMLGYSNPSKLAKIESGEYSTQVPVWTLARAASLYGASTDWILGVCDDFESPEPVNAAARAVHGLLRDTWERQRQRDVRAIVAALLRVAEVEKECATLARLATAAESALAGFTAANPAFIDMPAGAPLARAVPQTAAAASRLCARLVKLREDADRLRD